MLREATFNKLTKKYMWLLHFSCMSSTQEEIIGHWLKFWLKLFKKRNYIELWRTCKSR